MITDFAEKVFRTTSYHDAVSPESFGQWEGIVKAKEQGLAFDTRDPAHLNKLRFALLDFIADFACAVGQLTRRLHLIYYAPTFRRWVFARSGGGRDHAVRLNRYAHDLRFHLFGDRSRHGVFRCAPTVCP